MIVPALTIVGDSEEERAAEREFVRASMSFYGSTRITPSSGTRPGSRGRLRGSGKQKAGDFAGMAAQITDEHIAAFATESSWDGLADALKEKYHGLASRIVLYNALNDPQRVERYGRSPAACGVSVRLCLVWLGF